MRPFLSTRHPDKQLVNTDWGGETDVSFLARVTAYPVPALVGQSFTVSAVEEVALRLRDLLAATLPKIDWWAADDWSGPFEKYGLLHGSLPAPLNELTGEAMALEVYGMAERTLQHGTNEWLAVTLTQMGVGDPDGSYSVIRIPMPVNIPVATYSNLRVRNRHQGPPWRHAKPPKRS